MIPSKSSVLTQFIPSLAASIISGNAFLIVSFTASSRAVVPNFFILPNNLLPKLSFFAGSFSFLNASNAANNSCKSLLSCGSSVVCARVFIPILNY